MTRPDTIHNFDSFPSILNSALQYLPTFPKVKCEKWELVHLSALNFYPANNQQF